MAAGVTCGDTRDHDFDHTGYAAAMALWDLDMTMATGHDERNVANLVFISAQDRLPADHLLEERTLTRSDGKVITVSAQGMQGIGLPCGLASDILVALINLYIELGCPPDSNIYISAHALLRRAGMLTSVQYYRALNHHLDTLNTTLFTVRDGWYETGKKRYQTEKFNIINSLGLSEKEVFDQDVSRPELDSRSILRIQLTDQITASIRSGFLKALNLPFYHALPTVGARQLYRFLDARLDEAGRLGLATPYQFSLEVLALAEQLTLLDRRPHSVRSNLERMHRPLLERGYLADATFVGRGKASIVQYTFGTANAPVNPEYTEALVAQGVQRGLAQKYARELGESVYVILGRFTERKQQPGGKKIGDEGAYLASMLRDASSILEAEQVKKEKRAVRRQAPRKTSEEEAEQVERAHVQRLLESTPENRASIVLGTFQMQALLKRGLDIRRLDQLRGLVNDGQLSAETLDGIVTRSLLPGEPGQIAFQELKDLLSTL